MLGPTILDDEDSGMGPLFIGQDVGVTGPAEQVNRPVMDDGHQPHGRPAHARRQVD
ncbi:MAG: hypothetical protein LH624_04655 [Cryobacterium sp.]|nr:hypothetical protein [Cryobacterium sp.]